MLTLQQFKVNGHIISLKNVDQKLCIIAIKPEDDTDGVEEQRIEIRIDLMRKLARIIKDSPFIFSERNNEK